MYVTVHFALNNSPYSCSQLSVTIRRKVLLIKLQLRTNPAAVLLQEALVSDLSI